MILSCQHITKEFPERTVLSDVTFHLEKGDKAALVGVNGAGKSTLLRIIIGEMEPDSGTVSFQHDTTWGYLAQNQNLDTDNTIYDELLTVKKDLVDMEQRIALDEKLMAELTGEEQSRVVIEYNDLLEKFRAANGFAYKGEITGVLRGLGFADEEFGQRISTLSGGQKTRVALAKLLLEKPDLIMLDEPTNHLDIGSIRWLETYLSNYRGTVLVVSHDRYFLDKCVTKIIELENGHATLFPGNYSWYAERKKALREEAWHQYLNNQAEIRHQEEVITKLKQFNREKSIKRAESREKMLAKTERVEKPVELRDNMHLVLRPCIRSGRDVCSVRHLSKSFEGRHLFDDLTFDVQRGEHVAIIGSNGTGKSTLLKIIIGQLAADEGKVDFGTNVHIGYYDQEHHVLHDDKTLFEEISDEHPDMTNTEIRTLLASFLFTNEDVFKYIRDLSGGEKGRVSLAKLMLSEANFLILDEPTNHLDLVSKEVLENALNSYEGTVLYVSHDRYFINHTASRILSLTDKLLLNYPGNNEETVPERFTGNYDLYLDRSATVEPALIAADVKRMADDGYTYTPEVFDHVTTAAPGGAAADQQNSINPAAGSLAGQTTGSTRTSAEETPGRGDSTSTGSSQGGAAGWQQQKEQAAAERKKRNALQKCEEQINQLEARNAAIDEEMALPENAADLPKLTALQKEKDANTAALDPLYEQWEALQE